MDGTDHSVRACHTCGLVQSIPTLGDQERAHCVRCLTPFSQPSDPSWTLAASIAALLLFPLAMSLPVLSIERFGISSSTDIWHGACRLLSNGHLMVGLIVLVCSICIPLIKLLGLVALTIAPRRWRHRHRALTWRLIDAAGRWGMVDVMLVAGVVAAVKLGDLVTVSPGPGAAIYAMMVTLSLVAGATFDPQRMWPDDAPN